MVYSLGLKRQRTASPLLGAKPVALSETQFRSQSESSYSINRLTIPNHDDVGSDPSDWEKLLPDTIQSPSFVSRTEVKRVVILYNPYSGAKHGTKLSELAKRTFEAHGVQVDLCKTQYRGHARELLQNIDVTPYDVICLLGGDGTLHEAINGYMSRTDMSRLYTPLAVLPGGTGNSMALELFHTARLDVAIQRVLRGLSAPIDIARVYFPLMDKTMYSFNSLHWGLGSQVNVTAEKLRWLGHIRYGAASIIEILRAKRHAAVIETLDIDGKRDVIESNFSLGIANNIKTAAKGMKIAPKAKLNDGQIDVVLITSKRMDHLARTGRRFYNGKHTQLPYVSYRQVAAFSVAPLANKEVGEDADNLSTDVLDVDGELTGTTPFQCVMMRQSLRIIM